MKVKFDDKYDNVILQTETEQEKQMLENEFRFHGGSQPWPLMDNGYEGEPNEAFGLDIKCEGYSDPQKQWRVTIGICKAPWNYD